MIDYETLCDIQEAYICELNDQDNHSHHTIGIDCSTQYIYDGSQQEFMTLKKSNLDR